MPPLPHRLGCDPFQDHSKASACVCAHLPKKRPGSKKTTPKGAKKAKSKKEEEKRKEEARASRAAKKAFNEKKQALAEEFLKKVDKKVGKGRVEKALEENGPVRIVWTKLLRTAAGTARWRVDRYEDPEGKIYKVENFATVELSDRIIDNECMPLSILPRKLSTLAKN